MAIDFKRQEYLKYLPQWQLINAVTTLDGVEDHLITLNDFDKSAENTERNRKYKARAVAYPIAGHTLEGLVGLLFAKDPTITLPPELEYLRDNADGAGVSLYQQAQDVASDVAGKGRGGLWTTFPEAPEGGISQDDINRGLYVATIHEIEAERIINWRTTTVGSSTFLSLVVFTESVEVVGEDGYSIEAVPQIRELALDDGVYTVRAWQKNAKTDKWEVISESIPADRAGKSLNRIPFSFVGARSNSAEIDNPPMLALSKINLAHFRNSADFEDSCWFVGQAQPWMSGITQSHVDLMQKNNMYVGSRNTLGVPSGEQFGFAAAPPNPLVRQAMLDKVEMMIGLGARFIQRTGTVKTATESESDDRGAYCPLALISGNISEAYAKAIEWAGLFMGSTGEVVFELTKDFVSPNATAQELQAMIAGFVQGAIPIGAYFAWLKRVGLEDDEKTIEQFAEEVGASTMPNLDAEQDSATL